MKDKILILNDQIENTSFLVESLASDYKIYTSDSLAENYDLVITDNIDLHCNFLSLLIINKNNISFLEGFKHSRFSDYLLWPTSKEDIRARVAVQLENKNSEIRAYNLTIDELTKIHNRKSFDQTLKNYCSSRKDFSLLMMDIDNFKQINDKQGHLVGDEALLLVAQTAKKNLRPLDFVARFGGDEFAIILLETNLDKAYLAAERLRKAVFQAAGLSVSIGISYHVEQDDSNKLIKRADDALLKAKSAGKNLTLKEQLS